MAKQVQGIKTVPIDADTLIIKDSADGDNLKEITLWNLNIDNVQLTATVNDTKTYTIWWNSGRTINKWTLTVVDGADGSGNMMPDYQSGTQYEIWEVVVDDDGFVYRATAQTTGNKPQTSWTIHASWELINLWGVNITHNATEDYTTDDIILIDKKLYSPVNNITASWAAPVAFVIGYGVNEWYNIATGLYPYHSANETVTINSVRRVWERLFQANTAIAGATSSVAFVEWLGINQWRSVGLLSPNTHVSNWIYAKDEMVLVNNIPYQANSAMNGSSTAIAFATWWTGNTWRLIGTVQPVIPFVPWTVQYSIKNTDTTSGSWSTTNEYRHAWRIKWYRSIDAIIWTNISNEIDISASGNIRLWKWVWNVSVTNASTDSWDTDTWTQWHHKISLKSKVIAQSLISWLTRAEVPNYIAATDATFYSVWGSYDLEVYVDLNMYSNSASYDVKLTFTKLSN